jgi:hypothetical protein
MGRMMPLITTNLSPAIGRNAMPSAPTTISLILHIQAGEGVDADELDRLTRQLRDEIEELGIESVELVREGIPPSGSKVVEPVSLGGLAIKILPAALPALISHVRDRLLFGDNKVKIKTQVADRSLEVEYSPQAISPAELKSLVASLTEALTGPTAERVQPRVDGAIPAEGHS